MIDKSFLGRDTGESKNVYDDAGLQGESTIVLRKEMLAKKQKELRASMTELEESISFIDWKQNFYDEVLSGKRPYISNLSSTTLWFANI